MLVRISADKCGLASLLAPHSGTMQRSAMQRRRMYGCNQMMVPGRLVHKGGAEGDLTSNLPPCSFTPKSLQSRTSHPQTLLVPAISPPQDGCHNSFLFGYASTLSKSLSSLLERRASEFPCPLKSLEAKRKGRKTPYQHTSPSHCNNNTPQNS